MIRDQEALDYHSKGRKGKVEVVATKPCSTQRDLSLAYTPGVAVPCLKIADDPGTAYEYTAKGNLVAVISNGTAVLGLGNIGALAGKPVMEGKGVLFKRFADIDVFDIEIDAKDPEDIIKICKALEPTFGGINLEDIKAPECFVIEETLRRELSIPVFHDDQHGTAIISAAAMLNACEVTGKRLDEIKVVFNGAGASGIACAKLYLSLGVHPKNLVMCDTKGVVYKGRTEKMNRYKAELAAETDARTLAEAMRGADVFVGLSVANCVTQDMVKSMAERPVIFAMANPDPEITYEAATEARSDVIMATGRSDYPNQVNNVLGFPFIFRGALDVRATAINEEMKVAAVRALASLAKEDVPDSVARAYGVDRLHFGPEYLIPKPFDHRVLIWEASAVAKAAMDSGVARIGIDIEEYRERLESRLGRSREILRRVINQARRSLKRVVFPEGTHDRVLRACQSIAEEGIAHPVLLGRAEEIEGRVRELDLHLDLGSGAVTVVDPERTEALPGYVDELFRLRQRKGVTRGEARDVLRDPTAFGAMMLRLGDADALVAGIAQHYPDTIRPALQIIGTRKGVSRVAGLYLMVLKDRTYFFADTTVNIDPTAEELADIAVLTAEEATRFNVVPRVAMISFSNFGGTRHPQSDKVRRAVEIVKQRQPGLMIDGEVQADLAVTPAELEQLYPFTDLKGGANVLIFADLNAANAAYKLVKALGGAEAIGPILMGMNKPVHVLQLGSTERDVVNITAIAAVDAQKR